ncbi:28S rRNA (uridine-N(3))-methyltransferase isoform X3 [Callithrix jacchus]|uniref:putative methyltransferase C9orf114 homolog isoform X3 n=1 Tax=Callithrix jacchus TaxID=9483 RepID=UPI00083FB6B0|nr:putative methyltransferase C9orf114 homolog isoform X3 [Callithrix jacchus]XP_054100483.1 putative methyltransferase C9orf114 homolog isoform X3 [Callithrix jacchus]
MEATEERGEKEMEGSQADEKTGEAAGTRGTGKAPGRGGSSGREGGARTVEGQFIGVGKKGQACVQLARILQYLECPQYLRKAFFPKHQDLQFAGLLNPLDSPHHMRQDEESEFREGVVVDRPTRPGHGSFVNCGMKKEVKIDKNLEPGLRVTVRLNQQQLPECKTYRGKVVSSQDPRTKAGLYWGYTVRLASCLSAVFAEAPFQDGYDLTIGTSERGSDVASAQLPNFRGWKLEWMLTPTWRWLNPVSSSTCTSTRVLARAAAPSARRKPSSSPWLPCSLASSRQVPGTPERSKGPRTSVKQ